MKLLLLGDTHGVGPSLSRAINFAQVKGLDAIFQVGDFGYWPRSGTTRSSFIATAADSPVPIYWLPGNHEDWDEYEVILDAVDKDDDGFGVWGAMRITPKTHSWTWDGLRFGSLGGAYSVDRSMRTQGVSWFEQELPQWEDVEALPDKVDVLLTHEAPVNLADAHGWSTPRGWKIDKVLSAQSQGVIAHAAWKTTPSLLVHGHWHIRMNYYFNDTFVQGLDQASTADIHCMMILDTEAKALYDLVQFTIEGATPQWQLA